MIHGGPNEIIKGLGELRLDDQAILDEYIIDGVCFHLERMSNRLWQIMLTTKEGKVIEVAFQCRRDTVPWVSEDI